MAVLTQKEILQRGEELRPAREFAFCIWQKEPKITLPQLRERVKGAGYDVCRSTVKNWIARWRKGRGLAQESTLTITQPYLASEPYTKKFTFDEIVELAPSLPALGTILVEGFLGIIAGLESKFNQATLRIAKLTGELEELKGHYDALFQDRRKLMGELNERVAKKRVWTIDKARNLLVPKDK